MNTFRTCMKLLNISCVRIVIQSPSHTHTAFQRIIEDKLFDLKYPSSQQCERNNMMYLDSRRQIVSVWYRPKLQKRVTVVAMLSLDIVNFACGSLRSSTSESIEVNDKIIKVLPSLLRLLLITCSYIDTLIISNMSEQMSSSSVSIFLLQLWIRLSFSASPCHDIRRPEDVQTQC